MVASYDLQPGNGAGAIFWKVRDRRRNRREGKTHKKVKGKIQKEKVSKTKIQISHIHTVPKSTSESQAQITHLLTAPEPARDHQSRSLQYVPATYFLALAHPGCPGKMAVKWFMLL